MRSILYISGLADGTSIRLIDIYGREVRSHLSSGTAMRLDLSAVPAGMYTIYMTDAAGRVTADKIVKQ
ncbi:hypothetical protein D3C87_1963840 [compost metagenome]